MTATRALNERRRSVAKKKKAKKKAVKKAAKKRAKRKKPVGLPG